MVPLAANTSAFALAAFMAMLAASTTLTLAAGVSMATARGCACAVLLCSLALGFGLWATNFVEVFSLGLPERPIAGIAGLIMPFAIAASCQTCALLFVACREPDASEITGSAFALAFGVGATHLAALGDPLGQLVLPDEFPWICGSFLVTFVTFLSALWVWLKRRHDRSWRAAGIRILVTIAAGTGVLAPNAQALVHSHVVFGGCCEGPAPARLLMISIAAVGCAVLTVAQVIALCCDRLKKRADRSARDLEEAHSRLHYLATHDSLTGLPNRQRFKDRLAKSIADTKRPGRAVAIALFDLDHFSALNHSLGHGVGDWLLTEVARRVTAVISNSTTLARLDGDEFAVLIDDVAARLEAQAVTDAILATFEEPLRVNGKEIHVRSTIGVSVWPDDGRRADDLLAHAEIAMTIAKERGRGQALFFQSGMNDSMQERLAFESDLRRALVAREFELYYQPEISIRTGRIVAAEALLRWRHPTKGLIGPTSFISLAEETGLMIPLGEWVLREACRQARVWQVEKGFFCPVAVNLSATQFSHHDILQTIRSALSAAGLHGNALEIELTESALMTNPEESAGILKQLRKMGVTVAIDDFGTGYSSLSYLRRFPIDKLKIDRSFIRDLAVSRTDESIVRAIVSLARSVGLQVVAEGIESAEQLELVARLECAQWQGYHCCPPQPAERFETMLAGHAETRTGLVAALAALVAQEPGT
jgi:diguanylate cyclase (GGDEF)-like protein